MTKPGPPPQPTELRRRRGNPGKRAIPDPVVMIPNAEDGVPDPPDDMGAIGPLYRAAWDRVWAKGATWLSPTTDLLAVHQLCLQIEEREHLRARVYRDGLAEERRALRQLDKVIGDMLSKLALTPTDRARGNLAEAQAASLLSQFQDKRRRRTYGEIMEVAGREH